MIDTREITRLEVIDHRKNAKEQGRVYVVKDVKITFSLQDKDLTLKIFINNREEKNGK